MFTSPWGECEIWHRGYDGFSWHHSIISNPSRPDMAAIRDICWAIVLWCVDVHCDLRFVCAPSLWYGLLSQNDLLWGRSPFFAASFLWCFLHVFWFSQGRSAVAIFAHFVLVSSYVKCIAADVAGKNMSDFDVFGFFFPLCSLLRLAAPRHVPNINENCFFADVGGSIQAYEVALVVALLGNWYSLCCLIRCCWPTSLTLLLLVFIW